jgi:large subunit ribosomal protein L29
MMKINKITEMSSPELEKELGELKTELFKLRFSLATNGLDNPMKIKEVKKDIARINTVLRQRELETAKKGVQD